MKAQEMSLAASKAFDSVKKVIVHTMRNVYFIIQEDLPKEKLASLNKHCIIQVSYCTLSLQIIIYHAYCTCSSMVRVLTNIDGCASLNQITFLTADCVPLYWAL